MSISVAEQLDLFDLGVKTKQWEPASTTFIDNMKLPVHRWFRYSAGFSAEWVKETIRRYAKDWSMILEPFAGSGTTLVAANEMRFPSIGFEKQYFVNRIATVDYYRHGTTTLFAALDVLSGTVIGACKQKHRASECLEFIQKVDKSYPPERALHIIADNYATHKTRAVREYMDLKLLLYDAVFFVMIEALHQNGRDNIIWRKKNGFNGNNNRKYNNTITFCGITRYSALFYI